VCVCVCVHMLSGQD